VRADEDAEAGGVPDLQFADVQQEVPLPFVDARLEGVPDEGRRLRVEPADEVDLGTGPDDPDLHLALHARPLALVA
jgi:hypothetical protein